MNENFQLHQLPAPGVRLPYVQPRVKVRPCEPSGLLAGSGGNGAGQAGQDDDIDDGAVFGGGAAKDHRGIFFSDLWDE